MNILQNLKDVSKIKLITVLIFCIVMFFPVIGNWAKYGIDDDCEYYSLWGICLSYRKEKICFGYSDGSYAPSALQIIITCVILAYVLLIAALMLLILLPTSNVFIVSLITAGLLSCISYFLWIKTSPEYNFSYSKPIPIEPPIIPMPCLYLELIGGLLIVIFGIVCHFFKLPI